MNQTEQTEQKSQAAQGFGGASVRRNEDIALDLLKFVASATNILRTTAPSTGFTAASTPKPEDQVTTLLELYGRCLSTVKGTD